MACERIRKQAIIVRTCLSVEQCTISSVACIFTRFDVAKISKKYLLNKYNR